MAVSLDHIFVTKAPTPHHKGVEAASAAFGPCRCDTSDVIHSLWGDFFCIFPAPGMGPTIASGIFHFFCMTHR